MPFLRSSLLNPEWVRGILGTPGKIYEKEFKCLYEKLYDIYTWNPNDPCFDWKRPCFGGLTFKNRGHVGSRYIYIFLYIHIFGIDVYKDGGIFKKTLMPKPHKERYMYICVYREREICNDIHTALHIKVILTPSKK